MKQKAKDVKMKNKKLKKAESKSRRLAIAQLKKNIRREQKLARKAKEEEIYKLSNLDPKMGRVANWFRLDNAAMIYPPARGRDWNFVFRVSAIMKDKIDPVVLQQALNDILIRFPSFNVSIKSGFFWNYFEINFHDLFIERETAFPCQPFDLSNSNAHLIRVLYTDYRLSLECFHALTDGRGAMFFLNSLIARYLVIKGEKIEEYKNCASAKDLPAASEIEDSFLVNYTKEKLKRPKEHAAYKIKGTLFPAGVINTTTLVMSASKLKEVAHSYGMKIGAFLAAIVGYAVNSKRNGSKKPVRISVPIDLRSTFGSQTLRNFSSYLNIEMPLEQKSLEETMQITKTALDGVDKKFLQANINANVALQKNVIIKAIPLFLKNPIMKLCFNYMGENYQTLAISNVGKIDVPDIFEKYIERYEVNLGRSKHNGKAIGVATYGDILTLTISSKISESVTERDIATLLVSLGVDVKVESNRRDLYAGN